MNISNISILLITSCIGFFMGLVFGRWYAPDLLLMSIIWGILIALSSSWSAIVLLGRVRRTRAQKDNSKAAHILPPQIDSVFLYNTLHNISALADISPEKASRTVEQLATFIRAVSEMNEAKTTLLNEEIRVAELFLQIEQARLGERLKIIKNIDATCLEIRVPCFILLPLVENCVRHGIEVFDQNVEIFILANCENQQAVIEISDTGRGVENEDVDQLSNENMGLSSVNKCIKSFFGSGAKLTVEALVPTGTRVSLFLPLDENYA